MGYTLPTSNHFAYIRIRIYTDPYIRIRIYGSVVSLTLVRLYPLYHHQFLQPGRILRQHRLHLDRGLGRPSLPKATSGYPYTERIRIVYGPYTDPYLTLPPLVLGGRLYCEEVQYITEDLSLKVKSQIRFRIRIRSVYGYPEVAFITEDLSLKVMQMSVKIQWWLKTSSTPHEVLDRAQP